MSYEQMLEEQEFEAGRDNGYWVGGVLCATYEEACIVSGADTPDSLAAESQWRWEEECIADQDAIEARGGPEYRFHNPDLDIPF